MTLTRAGTELQAANEALDLVKQPPIGDFADGSARARAVARHFGTVRDALLADHDWQFATAWATPAQSGTSPGPLSRRFPLDADVIKVRLVRGMARDEWAMEASAGGEVKVLVTNAIEPVVCYTRRIEQPALWEPLFTELFLLRLASVLARPLLKSETRSAELAIEAAEKLGRAQKADRREQAPGRVTRTTSWIRARR